MSDAARLSAAQFELAARLILDGLPVRLEAGPWWGYRPAAQAVDYPRALLAEWPPDLMVAALAHEAAEARFTGQAGGQAAAHWVERRAALDLPAASLTLLVNVINDMRVNRLAMTRYPGLAALFRRLYGRGVELEPMTDAPGIRADDRVPLHHQYLDALIHAWTERCWPAARPAPQVDPPVSAAIQRTWPAVRQAAARPDVPAVLDIVDAQVLPAYRALLVSEREAQRQAAAQARAGPPAPDPSDPGTTLPSDESASTHGGGAAPDDPPPAAAEPTDAGGASAASPARPRPGQRGDAAEVPPVGAVQPSERRRAARARVRDRVLSSTGDSWHPGLVSMLQRGSGPRIDYDQFDYLRAVRKLEPLIQESIHGGARRRGLADIMDRRRHGAVDPWRRPRSQRVGDSGEIDLEHPERLVTDPAQAFLRGVRVARDDRQRDFANAILLDISGSMVQRGFPTRKFDRLVEAAVIFIEIHERLRIPYAVLSFSSAATVHWRFAQCVWTSERIPSSSSYRPRDHSQVFRALYRLDHRDTDDAGALALALRQTLPQAGLKSVIVITDGISSDPAELRRTLADIDRRNRNLPADQTLRVLAFGVGVVRDEFERAYAPRVDGRPLRASHGEIVYDTSLLPTLIRNAVDQRIRAA